MKIETHIVATAEENLSPPLEISDNLRPLRERLASLMDKVNLSVQLAGLEPDDCVLERYGHFRFTGENVSIQAPIECLTHREGALKPFLDKHLGNLGTMDGPQRVEITALAIHALRMPDFPPHQPPPV